MLSLRLEPSLQTTRRLFPAPGALLLVSLLTTVTGCGGSGGNQSTALATPAPTRSFTGEYSGGVTLPQGRTSYFLVQVADDGAVTGAMDVLAGDSSLRAPLTGTVNQTDGSFAVSGSYRDAQETIPVSLSGNLPPFRQSTPTNITVSWHSYEYTAAIASGILVPVLNSFQ